MYLKIIVCQFFGIQTYSDNSSVNSWAFKYIRIFALSILRHPNIFGFSFSQFLGILIYFDIYCINFVIFAHHCCTVALFLVGKALQKVILIYEREGRSPNKWFCMMRGEVGSRPPLKQWHSLWTFPKIKLRFRLVLNIEH